MRIAIRVHPGARRAAVGGRRGDELCVAVTDPPVDGAANAAVIRAVADAFGVRPRQVSVVRGATARSKVLELDVADADADAAAARLAELLDR